MQERTRVLAQLQEQSLALKQSNDLLQVQMQERRRAEEQASRQSPADGRVYRAGFSGCRKWSATS
jgi:hypothetical protein